MKKSDHIKTLTNLYLVARRMLNFSKKVQGDMVLRSSLLVVICEKPRTVRELTDMCSVQHSFMSSIITKMEEEGLLKKRTNKDKRYRLISITPKGRKMLEFLIEKNGRRRVEGFFANMTDKEIDQLDQLILKFNFSYKPGPSSKPL